VPSYFSVNRLFYIVALIAIFYTSLGKKKIIFIKLNINEYKKGFIRS